MDKDTLKSLFKFVPQDLPELDELEAIEAANKSIEEFGTIPHDQVNWD